MDEKLRLASLTAFYFGSRVATTTPPTTREAIADISYRAYLDLCRTLTGIGIHPDRTDLLEATHASLHEFITDLTHVRTRDDFDARHDAWCLKRMKFFKDHPHPDKEEFTFTYGQAQKWINMTLKYLAILDLSSVRNVYPYLHVPVDTIVYEEAEHPTAGIQVTRPPDETVWSQLDGEQYREYQRQLREAIATYSRGSLAPLDWEARAWINRASRPQDSSRDCL